jgi:LmbE family N-acetylglucosaminyl deacetylase
MAHPDDAEILIGGTLFHLKSLGWELGIMTMTGGDCGSATHTSEEISRIRQAEAKAAADYLGAWYGCACLMDIEIFANADDTALSDAPGRARACDEIDALPVLRRPRRRC